MLMDVFSTDSPHSYRYQMCTSSHRLVLLFVWGRRNAELFFPENGKKLTLSFKFTFRDIDDVISLINNLLS